MLEKLLESLDEKIFTTELKQALEARFNEAVQEKASLIAEEQIEEKIDSLNEKSEEHIEFLNKKADEYIELKQAEMIESLDKYLDRIVEEFLNEAKNALDESVKNEKADMIIEAFDAMLVATGVKVSQIVEAKEESTSEAKLQESIEKYDSLVEENISLKEENEKLIKMGVISEMCEGLTIIEADRFKKLAELVEFSRDSEFTSKLGTIKETVKGVLDNKETPEHKLVESKTADDNKSPIWAHLV